MGLLTKLQKSYQTEVSFLDDSYSKLNNLTPVSIMEQIEPTKVRNFSSSLTTNPAIPSINYVFQFCTFFSGLFCVFFYLFRLDKRHKFSMLIPIYFPYITMSFCHTNFYFLT
jgi:hypothetical protein